MTLFKECEGVVVVSQGPAAPTTTDQLIVTQGKSGDSHINLALSV